MRPCLIIPPISVLLSGPLIVSVIAMGEARDFKPPGPAQRLKAIGPTEGLEKNLRRALDPGDHFKPIPAPGPSDWLASFSERGQTFEDFVKSGPGRPSGARRKIYLLPLGEFPPDRSPEIESLREYTAAYFCLEAQVLPRQEIEGLKLTTRRNPHSGNLQILTGDVIRMLKKKLPADGYCLIAFTMVDLYPDPSWNFVFGAALLSGRIGVYSFARYDPAFYGEKRTGETRKMIQRRSSKVLVHEVGHMFGLKHCIYFLCVMNGSNHLKESESRPLHLCPVCLRKLQNAIGFDVLERYGKLEKYYRKAGFPDEERWMKSRRKVIQE